MTMRNGFAVATILLVVCAAQPAMAADQRGGGGRAQARGGGRVEVRGGSRAVARPIVVAPRRVVRPIVVALSRWMIIDSASTGSPATRTSSRTSGAGR